MQHIESWKLLCENRLSLSSTWLLSVFLFELGKGAAQLQETNCKQTLEV